MKLNFKVHIFLNNTHVKLACVLLFSWICIAGSKDGNVNIKTFLFTGDICFAETYQERQEEKGKENILKKMGYDYSLAKLDTLLFQSDYIIGNLETPITDMKVSPLDGSKKYKIHKADIILTPLTLKKHHISIVSLANNHTMDYGTQGLEQTMEILKKYSIDFFAAGKNEEDASAPFQINNDIGQKKFHLVVVGGLDFDGKYEESYNFYASEKKSGVKGWTQKKVLEQIRKIRQTDSTAFIVAYPHWFENYKWKSERQTMMAHTMIDAGADIVIGHGTHMFQELEIYNSKWIVYSLGNFMFNSPGRYEKENAHSYSLAGILTVNNEFEKQNITLKLYPILSDNLLTNYQPRLLDKKEFNEATFLIISHSPEPEELKKKIKFNEDKLGSFLELNIR